MATALAERAVDRRDQPAIVTPMGSVTFGELASRVASLATTILDADDTTSWLPVFVDRSIDSTVAILAAIHAGRPFVPIDAELPSTRIEQLLSRIDQPRTAVMATPDLVRVLPSGTVAIPLGVDHSTPIAPIVVDQTSPGAIFFTSGSTGMAKGVVRTWSSINRRLGAVVPRGETIRGSHLQPLNFSGGISKTVRVAAGETVCMVDPRKIALDELVAWLAQVEITDARLGGGHVDALLRRPDLTRWLPSVREFSVFGSRRDWSQVPLIRRLCSPGVSIVNSYTATEVGNVSQFVVTPEMDVSSGRLPNGTLPIDRLRLVADGDSQEIWVRNPDAIEYLGDPELNDRKFVVDHEGVRWWRSGDLGRIDNDGLFYFLGRLDLMVKINGMRVEPEEAEHALRSIRGIASAAVVAHPTSNGSHRLVGHVCVDDDSLTPDRVKAELSSTLPTHLVPVVLVRHDSLPYTDRQKLDRQQLLSMPVERWTQSVDERKFSLESHWIASKVEQIVGLGRIGPADDVWHAGLDSVGAVELCAVIAESGLGKIDPRLLLTARTPEQLDRHLGVRGRVGSSPVVVFNSDGHLVPIFAIPGTTATAFAYRALSESLGRDQPVVVVEPRGMHTKGRIEKTIEDRAASVVDEIVLRLQPDQMCILVSHSGGTTVAYEVARSLDSLGRKSHLIFLDGVPRDSSTRVTTSILARKFRSERSKFSSPVSFAKWTSRVVRRAPAKLWSLSMMPILVRFPGRRRYSVDHYKIFWWIGQRALKKYTLVPFDASASLLHVENNELCQRLPKWISLSECRTVGGDHISMLYPPHVSEIAEHVVRVRDRLMISSS